MKDINELFEEKFDSTLDTLNIFNSYQREELKKLRTEEEVIKITDQLMGSGKVYLIWKNISNKFGSSWPIWGDSALFPECHLVQLSITNLLILTHELAHIVDFERKSSNPHDDEFLKIWRSLCDKIFI